MHNSQTANFTRYFSQKQKVYLINVSPERDSEVYDSLSGTVTGCSADTIEVMIPHYGPGQQHVEAGKTSFKLTSEALGSGIQVLADLTGIISGNVFQLRLHGLMEMFQRRVVSRIEFVACIYQVCGNYSLNHFKKEWKRAAAHLRTHGHLPGLALQKVTINLSAGGIGFVVDPGKRPTAISLFIFSLEEDPPVCALAETVWEKRLDEGLRCGFRFISILKSDQERINNFVADKIRKSGGIHLDYKRNKVLLDKMG